MSKTLIPPLGKGDPVHARLCSLYLYVRFQDQPQCLLVTLLGGVDFSKLVENNSIRPTMDGLSKQPL